LYYLIVNRVQGDYIYRRVERSPKGQASLEYR
jgi:hypothetical protein